MSDRNIRNFLARAFRAAGAVVVFAGATLFVPKYASAKPPEIFLAHIQIEGTRASDDFVAIRNGGDCAVDLSGWKLRKRTASGTESSVRSFGSSAFLPPDEIFIWASSEGDFADSINAHEKSSATLAKDNALALLDQNDSIVDSLSWGALEKPFRSGDPVLSNPKKNESLVRDAKEDEFTMKGTVLPSGKTFEKEDLDFCGASKDRAGNSSVVLSEMLANPDEDESEHEYIEVENRGETAVDLSGWTLRDASKTGKFVFSEETNLSAHAFLVKNRTDFGFALNNTDETVTLFDAKGAVADTVSWKTSRKNIAIARDDARWRATKFQTPGEANRFGTDPSAKTKLPKKGFAKIPLAFSAKVKDGDGDPTKVVWDFGDGRRSYKADTTHGYAKKGTYRAILRYTDGIADIEKRFTVKITNYEAPKVRIAEIVPNPDGKDAKREYLVVENHSKKEVNLKGWIIATKSKTKTKNFTNHAIAKDFILKPGESKRLTAKHAAFTLGNTRQLLELRDPRKKTVQKVRYKLDQSAPENAVYFKEKNAPWTWRLSLPLDTETKEV